MLSILVGRVLEMAHMTCASTRLDVVCWVLAPGAKSHCEHDNVPAMEMGGVSQLLTAFI